MELGNFDLSQCRLEINTMFPVTGHIAIFQFLGENLVLQFYSL